MSEQVWSGNLEGVWDDPFTIPPTTPDDPQNTTNRQTELMLSEATEKYRRVAKEAWLS